MKIGYRRKEFILKFLLFYLTNKNGNFVNISGILFPVFMYTLLAIILLNMMANFCVNNEYILC